MNDKEEIWKDIPSCSPSYQASSLGRIRRIYKERGPRVMRHFETKRGYFRVGLSLNNQAFNPFVHTLVCEAFNGAKPEWATLVSHKDGNGKNNLPSNLEWNNSFGNERDKLIHGTKTPPEKRKNAKLNKQIVEIILAFDKNFTVSELSRKFCVSRNAIYSVIYGETWNNVSPEKPRKKRVRRSRNKTTDLRPIK